uniref:C-type lectin domain-containing protein n=1 Tax=Acrobeloides nanus TaxID=290746 RepID=A0A914DFS3_9BILA
MTCNPNWPEIKEALRHEFADGTVLQQNSNMRSNIIVRVFKQKSEQLIMKNQKYYHLNSTDAENYCILNGAHLTSIHSPDENNFIADFARTGMIFENGHEAQVYIGLNTFTQAGVYKWTDGTQLDYVNWAGGTPSNPNINPCVTLFADMDSRYESWYQQWPRVLCTDIERAFVCKKPANK